MKQRLKERARNIHLKQGNELVGNSLTALLRMPWVGRVKLPFLAPKTSRPSLTQNVPVAFALCWRSWLDGVRPVDIEQGDCRICLW